MQSTISFFWEKNSRTAGRARFNLLLLEYGEYYFDDFSAYLFPVPSATNPFHQCDALKTQGRLKLCSRSLIFEPNDLRKPLIKFPFKTICGDAVDAWNPSRSDLQLCTVEVSGFFLLSSTSRLLMMENGKIGPYRQVDSPEKHESSYSLFALAHSDLSQFLTKLNHMLTHFRHSADSSGAITPDGALSQLIRASMPTTFDTSQLVDFHEVLLMKEAVPVKRVRPLLINPGCLMLTESRIYFQPALVNNVGETMQYFHYNKITRVYKRRYLLRHTSIEIMLSDGSSALFSFDTQEIRNHMYNLIQSTQLKHPHTHRIPSLEQMMEKWQRKEVSNFEYLMFLNYEADRSLNDLTQYPVFPHIIADYTSDTLDLQSPSTFRDLSRPIGALNPQRLEHFLERFHSMPPADEALGVPPPFMYGTHYSTPGYVLHYLVRVAPQYMLCLQNGKFDAPDRTFLSVPESWESCLNNPADLKEMIPEFFTGSGSFLNNIDDLDLGHRHNGERLNDVELPPWAKNPRDFIRKNSKALESDYVSQHIHEWIDLIFGYKQRGEAAVENNNVFYYLTYEGAVDIEKESDYRRRNALEIQIQEFGQTPKQLFTVPHPSRNSRTVIPSTASDSVPSSAPSSASPSPVTAPSNVPSTTSSKPRSTSNGQQMPPLPPSSTASSKLPSSETPSKTRDIPKVPQPAKAPSVGSSFFQAISSATSFLDRTFRTSPSIPHTEETASPPVAEDASTAHVVAKPASPVELNPAPVSPQPSARPASDKAPFSPHHHRIPSQPPPSKVILRPSAAFTSHTDGITDVALSADAATASTTSRDSFLKVYQLDCSESTVRINLKRSSMLADPPLSACCLSPDGKYVYLGCYDNKIYTYSVVSAMTANRRNAHEDAISAMAIDKSGKWLVSGSWDTSVKIWSIKMDGSNVSSTPTYEFYDHDTPIQSVAIDSRAEYVAAGAHDGSVVVWMIDTETKDYQVMFSRRINSNTRPVMSVTWLPPNFSDASAVTGFSDKRLLCCCKDGTVTCIDSNNRLFAAMQLDTFVKSIDVGKFFVYGGCSDGSVRVWLMESGSFREVAAHLAAHTGGINGIALGKSDTVLVSGGEDGSLRGWKIDYQQ